MSAIALRCIDYTCTVEADDDLLDHIASLFEPCLITGPTEHEIVLARSVGAAPSRVVVVRDGETVVRDASIALGLARLVWEINQGVVAEPGARLLLHAAAVEHGGRVVLLPGGPGAGKSTLAAGLVRAGLRYVTDETVAIDATNRTVVPYPKPISLEFGSASALAPFVPEPGSVLVTESGSWLLAPGTIRPDAIAPAGCLPRIVVLPSYARGRATALRPISRAAAAMTLAEQAFNFATLPGALELVADLVRGCSCFELAVGDLRRACDLVAGLIDGRVAVGT
jgi:hypothetical protein